MHQPFVLQSKWIFFVLLLSCFTASAQPDFTLPLNKPEKYKDKELGAEKTDSKRFTVPRRLFQGMITHYNYYYNANRKIDEILERAKLVHKDDYNELLPFYNYSTNTTQGDSTELDSILYKASAGIVLHDLRNSYVDNLYQIIGKAYFYWRKFDSAHRIFQFINYNFFPKGKDEYIIVVGANNRNSNGELNIANKENKNIVHKAFSQPPSRNEALFWLAKTYAEDSLYPEALSVTNMLRKDTYFPKRLYTQLDEINAYVFYQEEQWDSCAFYLKRSLVNVENKSELARWEYLLAQLYSILKKPAEASGYFNKAKNHTTDPVMYIHARIYESQLVKNEQGNTVEAALNDLVKLSKKERFDGYEDVLFYAASSMALQLKDTAFAKALLQKSTKYNTENPSLRNKAFLKLAGIAFNQKDYEFAASCYDSLDLQDIVLAKQAPQLELRKTVLNELVKNIKTVKLQDSLQAVSRMPEKEMNDYLKSLVKKLRKQRGLKEEAETIYNPAVLTGNSNNEPLVLGTGGTGANWYFNNNSQKSKGFGEFITKWGKRPNVDNWRRIEAVNKTFTQQEGLNPGNPNDPAISKNNKPEQAGEDELTVDALKEKLPLTIEKLKASNLEILNALITQGQIYKNQLEDYAQAAIVFEEILNRFSNFAQEEEILFELYYCNKKAGNTQKANYFQSALNKKFPKGDFENKISTGNKQPEKDAKTIAYETIYGLFIEGNFTEALKQKSLADSAYGKSYWTPQLLYIQSLYYIKQKNDAAALNTLTDIETSFPGTPMAEKATIMKDVINRRAEIEDYLTNANIVREKDDVVIPFDDGPKVNKSQVETKEQQNKIAIQNKPAQNNNNLEKPKAPVQKTNIEKQERVSAKPGIGNIIAKDSTKIKPLKDVKVQMAYVYNANEPYVVMMLFEKVDPVYMSEAKIAFQRYNNSAHTNEGIVINLHEGSADDLSWIDIGPKSDITSILGYFDELKANARQIVPWLPADKYQFIFISQANLEILKQRKNLEEYKLFIRQYVKDKF